MERDLIDVDGDTFEVLSDGTTTWVNSNQFLMGRFGKNGYEFHFEDNSHSFVHTGNTYTFSSWQVFVNWFAVFYHLKIDIKHLPREIKRPNCQ